MKMRNLRSLFSSGSGTRSWIYFFRHSFKEPFMRGFPRASQSLKASPKHYVIHREKDSKKAKGREQCQKIWNVSLHSFAFRLILHCLVVNDEIRLAKCSEAHSSVFCHHCLKPTWLSISLKCPKIEETVREREREKERNSLCTYYYVTVLKALLSNDEVTNCIMFISGFLFWWRGKPLFFDTLRHEAH